MYCANSQQLTSHYLDSITQFCVYQVSSNRGGGVYRGEGKRLFTNERGVHGNKLGQIMDQLGLK